MGNIIFIDKKGNKYPKQDKLKIDKLSITLALPSVKEQQQLQEKVSYLKYNDYATDGPKGNYKNACMIFLQHNELHGVWGEGSLLVQYGPNQAGHKYVRIECNPDKAGMGVVKQVMDYLILDGYNRLMITGQVTRLDETVDLHFADIEEFLFYVPQVTCSSRYDKKGKLQTQYLGNAYSSRRWCIYDKGAEIKFKNSKMNQLPYSILCDKEKQLEYSAVRVEFRHIPKSKKVTMMDMLNTTNPFLDLVVVGYYHITDTDMPPCFDLFLDSCRYRGLQQASQKFFTKYEKKKYMDVIKNVKFKWAWWNPKSLGEQRTKLFKGVITPGLSVYNFNPVQQVA